MKQLKLDYIAKVNGEINIPGSKSISNRALLLAAMAEGNTTLTNLLDSDDIRYMLEALKQLGVSYSLSENNTVCEIEGIGKSFNAEEVQSLFLGNAGTAMRPLCAALTLGKGDFVLTGEPRMEERPIKDLVEALSQLGASITYLKQAGFPPVEIKSNGLKGGVVNISGSLSSQFLTALLMAAPMAESDITINVIDDLVSKPYIDITLSLMERFGVVVDNQNYSKFIIEGNQTYRSPGEFLVEGDASSASYFLAAAAIQGGSIKVTGVGVNSIQGDTEFANVLANMGAEIAWGSNYIKSSRGDLRAVDFDANHIPDAAMTIATTALFAKGTTTIRNIYNWRIKETDRLAAMATELRKVGADVVEGEDFISITPTSKIKHAEIDTYNDHRIAMCFSMVAFDEAGVTINDPGCTAKTFPKYFTELAALVQKDY